MSATQDDAQLNDLSNELSLSGKRKKKTKKESTEQAPEEVTENLEEEIGDIMKSLKKKKSKSKTAVEDADAQDETVDASDADSDEYNYKFLLSRIFDKLEGKTTEAENKKKIRLKAPSVQREGKKTFFINFKQICQDLNRSTDHVSNFIFHELATTGSIDSNNVLNIRGSFLPKNIEKVLKQYVQEYVLCGSCSSMDTTLERDPLSRLYILKCNKCFASKNISMTQAKAYNATKKNQNK